MFSVPFPDTNSLPAASHDKSEEKRKEISSQCEEAGFLLHKDKGCENGCNFCQVGDPLGASWGGEGFRRKCPLWCAEIGVGREGSRAI